MPTVPYQHFTFNIQDASLSADLTAITAAIGITDKKLLKGFKIHNEQTGVTAEFVPDMMEFYDMEWTVKTWKFKPSDPLIHLVVYIHNR